MFLNFRQEVKAMLRRNINVHSGISNYSQLAEKTGVEESTIKGFMCGASDSRRIAEKIADALDFDLVYSNGVYTIRSKEEGS